MRPLRAQVLEEIRKGKAYSHGEDANGNPLVFVCSRNFDPRRRDLSRTLALALTHGGATLDPNRNPFLALALA